MPGIALALNCNLHIRSKDGDRWVCADDFFLGPFTTVMAPEELLVEVGIPTFAAHTGMSYQQISRQRGSQYLAGVAVIVTLDADGKCAQARIVCMNVGEVPMVAQKASAMLKGQAPAPELLKEAARYAADNEIDPGSDVHATAEYRRHATGVLAERALALAFERARL
jgi:carbon-monoxide dehydrogenase medium subunit